MMLSVAICTRNRADSLRQTLESLTQMRGLDDIVWELLIIDNGSTDSTEAVVGGFADRLPVRRVFEAKPGLSNARNRAVDEARGDYLVWTDDDVTVDPGWLAAYAAAFRDYPDAVVFGGKILPVLIPPTPKWFEEAMPELVGLLAHRDFGDDHLALQSEGGPVPFGANYAIRMSEQKTFRYDPELGSGSPGGLLGEEETVIRAILDGGARGRWLPDCVVHHRIGVERQTTAHVMRYYRSQGRTSVFFETPGDPVIFFGVPRWLIRRLATRLLRYRLNRVLKPPRIWVRSLIDYAYSRGQVDYWRSSSRGTWAERR